MTAGVQGVWDSSRSHVRVLLRDVETEARVGLHPWERHPERPSRLIVNVEMLAPTGDSPAPATESSFIDYDGLRAAIKAWPQKPHTPLLESLAEELVELCLAQPRVMAARVSVVKPDIFNEAGAAGVEIFRVRAG